MGKRSRGLDPQARASGVSFIPFVGGDAALARALEREHPGAAEALCERHADLVDRILTRILGPGAPIPALIEQVFLIALARIKTLRDPDRLGTWMIGLAIGAARAHLRRRARLPAQAYGTAIMAATYAILDQMPIDDRLVFALRIIDAMSLIEIADACRISLATTRRRFWRAQARFFTAARGYPALYESFGGTGQWTVPSRG